MDKFKRLKKAQDQNRLDTKQREEEKDEESEEDDYMSASFVDEKVCVSSSLLWSRRQKYEHDRYKRKHDCDRKSKQTIKEMEHEKREEALARPIEVENRGFQLLQKMMLKNSDRDAANLSQNSTAKSSQIGAKREEECCCPQALATTERIQELMSERKPISIDIRQGRLGLGNEKKSKKVFSSSSSTSSSTKPEDIDRRFRQNEQAFREHRRAATQIYETKKSFYECQRVCANLEANFADGVVDHIPVQPWYWPPGVSAAKEAKKELPEDEEDDLKIEKEQIKSANEEEEEEEEEDVDFVERLQELNNYLRSKYWYCVWCGTRYDSLDDLQQNCPGDHRDDHE